MVERIDLRGLFDRQQWAGPVVRRDPDQVRQQSVITLWRCPNCREFAPEGSRAAEKCLICQTPMPEHARQGYPFPE